MGALMRSLSNTIGRLSSQRARSKPERFHQSRSALTELVGFGSNPGRLKAWSFVPQDIGQGAPLVVVLHGCAQEAEGFDRGSGWSQLAEEYGFAVLLPEQTRANNFNLCFNWYEPANNQRGAGEPLSIAQMINTMIERHDIDAARVFVTGLSAGGAMTSVMLATYPDVFAGGAIIAGLPYGSANTIPEAFDRMRGHGGPTAAASASTIRKASPPSVKTWPSVAVWHGTRDHVVDVSNGSAIVEQWRHVLGAPVAPNEHRMVDGYPHRAWRDSTGRVMLEEYLITDMGHGTPLATSGESSCGVSGPYMLDVAISSTRHIAAAWGLTKGPRKLPLNPRGDLDMVRDGAGSPAASAISQVIEDALRAAGLMLDVRR